MSEKLVVCNKRKRFSYYSESEENHYEDVCVVREFMHGFKSSGPWGWCQDCLAMRPIVEDNKELICHICDNKLRRVFVEVL